MMVLADESVVPESEFARLAASATKRLGGTSCGQCRRTSCGESATTGAGADVGTDAEAAAEDAPEPGALARVAARRRLEGSRDAERLRAARIPGSGGAWSVVTTGACGKRTEAPARAGAPGDEEHLRGGEERGTPREGTPFGWGPDWPIRPFPRICLGSEGLGSLPSNGGDAPHGRGWVSTTGSHPVPRYSRRGVQFPWGAPGVKTLKSRPQGLFPPSPPRVPRLSSFPGK